MDFRETTGSGGYHFARISFDGRGGFTSVSQVMSDLQATGNGGYSLTLPDGSGTITFLHTPNLNAGNFKVPG